VCSDAFAEFSLVSIVTMAYLIKYWLTVLSDTQEYFCDGTSQNAVSEVLSQKVAKRKGVTEPFLRGVGITDTSLSQNEFWVRLCVAEPLFSFRKIALHILYLYPMALRSLKNLEP
jgi:hypothetical protein